MGYVLAVSSRCPSERILNAGRFVDSYTLDATASGTAAGGEVTNKMTRVTIDINQGP